MNRVPVILAEVVKRGGSMNPAVAITVGVIVVAVVGGILAARILRKQKTDNATLDDGFAHTSSREEPLPTSSLNVGESDDAKIIRRLASNYRELFPAEVNFSLKPGWLYDEILVAKFDGNSEKCENLLQEIIRLSQGAYVAAAVVGETFDCRKMRTNVELPDDMRVSKVRLSGLIRATTGEVMIAAIVA